MVFDVGMVLIRANMDWRSAIQASGLQVAQNPFGDGHLYALPEYEQYERGDIDSEAYLSAVCGHFGLTSNAAALELHRAILGPEFPGVVELVRELAAKGIETATLSNNNPLHWEWIAEKGPYPGVQSIPHKWASFLLGATKPELEVYRRLEQTLDWTSAEITFFDDSEKYVKGALAAGWNAHQIQPGSSPVDQMRHLLRAIE